MLSSLMPPFGETLFAVTVFLACFSIFIPFAVVFTLFKVSDIVSKYLNKKINERRIQLFYEANGFKFRRGKPLSAVLKTNSKVNVIELHTTHYLINVLRISD